MLSAHLICCCHTRVVYPVEELGHGGEDRGPESLQVGLRELDAAAGEAHGAARHEHGELAAALQRVRQRQVAVEDVGAARRVHVQLRDGGAGGRHQVLV